jgi:hypothetical protein
MPRGRFRISPAQGRARSRSAARTPSPMRLLRPWGIRGHRLRASSGRRDAGQVWGPGPRPARGKAPHLCSCMTALAGGRQRSACPP